MVEIVCTEIDAYDPPCAKEEKSMYTTATDIDPVLRERMLQRYYRLKKILEEEGLLWRIDSFHVKIQLANNVNIPPQTNATITQKMSARQPDIGS